MVTITRKIPDMAVSSAVTSIITSDARSAIRYSSVMLTAIKDLFFFCSTLIALKYSILEFPQESEQALHHVPSDGYPCFQ